jgi:hypothetical protein
MNTMGKDIKTILGIICVVLGLSFLNSVGSMEREAEGIESSEVNIHLTTTPTVIPTAALH